MRPRALKLRAPRKNRATRQSTASLTAYRFCRSDDIPLLVEAYNRCYRADRPELRSWGVDDFKERIRTLDVWTSSCMVAHAGNEPIGVLIAAKRDHANWIYRVAVHPDHRRRGHGQHLLTSLSQKMAILEPTALLAELPAHRHDLCAFFEACGYQPAAEMVDFSAGPAASEEEGLPLRALVSEASLEQLEQSNFLQQSYAPSWRRTIESQLNVQSELEALAIASEVRIEARLVYRRESQGAAELLDFDVAEAGKARALFGALLSELRHRCPGSLHIDRVCSSEPIAPLLEAAGFRPGSLHRRYVAEAKPG